MLLFNKTTNKWDSITPEEKKLLPKEDQKRTLYMGDSLKAKLDYAKKQIRKNNDCVGIICGEEGSGKSALAGTIMDYMLNGEFDPKVHMIGSDEEDALSKIENAPDGSALFFDEGNVFFLSTEIMRREQRDLHKLFSIFRQKNLFVLIVLPSFFRLGSYFALDRSRFLIQTYWSKGQRGFYGYYGNKRKDKLYLYGKKQHDYTKVKPNFRGRFLPCAKLESQEYKAFKLKTLKKVFEQAKAKTPLKPEAIKMAHTLEIIKKNMDRKASDLAQMLGVTERYINRLKEKIRNEAGPKDNG